MSSWWSLTTDEAIKTQRTDAETGLAQAEAQARLNESGYNQLDEKKAITPLEIFISQFNDFIVWVLIASAVISGFLNEVVDSIVIVGIVILNSILGFAQQYRTEKSLAALKNLSAPVSKVIRDGQHITIPSKEIVYGDIIEVEAGDHIPADCRVIYTTTNFRTHDASLTGESTPVAKLAGISLKEDTPLADRKNMVYMGTSVVSGKAKAVVSATGMKTELGKIAGLIQNIKDESTPLQKKLEAFGKWIVYICLAFVAVVFIVETLRGGKVVDMFITAVSLAVAAIPEGLPAVVTISLALGVHRMVKRHAIIRKLPSVEALGCTTVICSDKTGTLTKNEMTVQTIFVNNKVFSVTGIGYKPEGEFILNGAPATVSGHPDLKKILSCAVLCNGANLISQNGDYKIIGDPTEGSILTAGSKAGILKNDLESQYHFIDELAFDSDRKKMSVIRKTKDNKILAFVKGAPEILLNDCAYIYQNGNVEELTAESKSKIVKMNADLAGHAMRVLAVAYRDFDKMPSNIDTGTIESGLTFLGLIGMIDPPREEVKTAMAECKTAGIKTVMITGDHKDTAVSIAKQLGFFKESSIALTGDELDKMSQQDLEQNIERIPVYARVSPENKLRIVRAWRKRGDIVAMTGDGVNDAPAVKEADIGVAMGITGTDVTKEVSDMIVTDDNFASIVSAVEEGRCIFDNITKFINYMLSCNVGEILVMFLSSILGTPAPMFPIHILWVNLITDGLPAIALSLDTNDPNIMNRKPRDPNEMIVTPKHSLFLIIQGIFIALCSLSAFWIVLYVEGESTAKARTMAFTVLSLCEFFHAFNCRSKYNSLFKIGVFSNMKLVAAVFISFMLQIAVIYVPFLSKIFKTQPLSLFEWLIAIVISSLPLWGMEIVKLIKRKNSGSTESLE